MRALGVLSSALLADGPLTSPAVSPALSAEPAHGTIAANLMQVVTSDRAASRVRSVIFGAWKGNAPLLTIAAEDSFSSVLATTDMHIRPGIVQTEGLCTILVQLADAKRTISKGYSLLFF